MSETSDRLHLPLIVTGQAQKESTHNEALALADILVQPVVVAVAPVVVPETPALGQCWIVGSGASGVWAGHDGALACWTSGGWRFAAPFPGMTAWNLATGTHVRRSDTGWDVGIADAVTYRVNGAQVLTSRQSAISTPSGGSVIDAEARIALGSVLSALRNHGLIAS